MDNTNPNVSKREKKSKFKGTAKQTQQAEPNQQAACCVTPQAQVQQAQQAKPQAV